ncbi:MAG: hypothetical protein OCD02_06475 [Spirochaetaceae bacterium]
MTYQDQVHKVGRITAGIVLFLIFLVPTVISVVYNIFPPIDKFFIGVGMVCMVYIPISIAEFLTYTPMLGSSASYLVFVTGNLTNLKIPCALTCIDNAEVKPQSEEAEIIATIAVAISSIVTTIIVFIGMLLIVPLQPLLEAEILKPAFAQILPALFGAMGGYWVLKQWKLAVTPILVIILVFIIFPIPSGVEGALIPVMGLISVLSAKFLYKKGFINKV